MNCIRQTQKYHRLDSLSVRFFIDIGTQICALSAFSRTRQTTWCAKSFRHHCSHPTLQRSTLLCTTHTPPLPATVLEEFHFKYLRRSLCPHSHLSNTKTRRRKYAPYTTTSWPRPKSIGLTISGRPSRTIPPC